ncbi:MAG: hypothetical protein IJI14_03975 [Anaerolineaceae bacterium]|nr:hypothetical protein [Anaerolineaceae bacterium]
MRLSDDALVLVAIMPNPRDMDIARLLGWYRIPLKSAPKILHPDAIAFYQTAAFSKGHKSQIECFAEVSGVELTTRAELFRDEPDHPRANEEYFKIQLRGVESLPHPILADEWKRFTFFYTTGSRIMTAESIRGLAMNARERGDVWRVLREREEVYGRTQSGAEEDYPEELSKDLLFLLGNLTLSGLDLETK